MESLASNSISIYLTPRGGASLLMAEWPHPFWAHHLYLGTSVYLDRIRYVVSEESVINRRKRLHVVEVGISIGSCMRLHPPQGACTYPISQVWAVCL